MMTVWKRKSVCCPSPEQALQVLMQNVVENPPLERRVVMQSLSPDHRKPACNFLLVAFTDC